MKFFITMNMPSNQGRTVHQMIVKIKDVSDISNMWRALSENVFILVDEYYYMRDESGKTPGTYQLRGPIIINTEYIGKVREMEGVFRNEDT